MLCGMELARIIFFTDRIEAMAAFYRRHFGLELVTDEAAWKELDAGGCRIALHANARARPNGHTPKIAFRCHDVATKRAELIAEGVPMGKLWDGEISFCDGVDPDGNAFSISNR